MVAVAAADSAAVVASLKHHPHSGTSNWSTPDRRRWRRGFVVGGAAATKEPRRCQKIQAAF